MNPNKMNSFNFKTVPETDKPETTTTSTDDKLSGFAIDNLPTPRPSAKEEVVRFLTQADFNQPFVVTVDGNVGEAAAFLHRMRVELSRMRNEVRRAGRTTKPFKMLLLQYLEKPNNTTEIHLQMAGKSRVDIAKAVENLAIGGD